MAILLCGEFMEIITSKSNPIVKYALSLKEKKHAVANCQCLVESEKIIHDLLTSKIKVSTLLISSDKITKFGYLTNAFDGKITYISPEIAKLLGETVTPSGVFALVDLPKNILSRKNFLVLENIQDPSNLGAILRSAKAFDYSDIILLGGVFPYSPKVIRSSMGYVFDANIVEMTLDEFSDYLHSHNFMLYCADMDGFDVANTPKTSCKYGIAFGNEGNGVSLALKNLCNSVVTIPMQNNVESLNVSVSAGIIMYNLNNINKEK